MRLSEKKKRNNYLGEVETWGAGRLPPTRRVRKSKCLVKIVKLYNLSSIVCDCVCTRFSDHKGTITRKPMSIDICQKHLQSLKSLTYGNKIKDLLGKKFIHHSLLSGYK